MNKFILLTIAAVFFAGIACAQVAQTKVHKPTGDKIQVESAGEIEFKSGSTLDIQSGTTVNMQGSITAPAGGWPLPIVDITVSTPAVAGLLVQTSASIVYVSTAAVGVANWIKVGAQ